MKNGYLKSIPIDPFGLLPKTPKPHYYLITLINWKMKWKVLILLMVLLSSCYGIYDNVN